MKLNSLWVRNVLASAGAIVAIGAASGFAAGEQGVQPQNAIENEMEAFVEYVAIPGVREFSGQMIVRPLQGMAAQGANRAQSIVENNFDVKEYVPQTDEYIIYVPAGEQDNDVSRELMATGLFQYVEPDWTVFPLACPNDPQLGSQWHHNANRMQSCDGWDIHTGNPTVGVGLCDTGVYTGHADLQLHRLEGYNAVDRVWENDGGQINDINNHGTWVTGCAAANGDNGIGVAGVGWNLSHRMMRVSNSSGGSASLSDLQHGARTSIEAGDKVASVSYSGVDSSSNLTTATYIKSIGGLLVWAAGNENRNLTLSSRDSDDIIVAAATDQSDSKASFSNYGVMIDVAAPGVSVYTTDRNGGYSAVSGTSFACPLTAGLCALIYSYNGSLTPDEVEAALKAGADDLGSPGIDNTYGHGRINVNGALNNASKPLTIDFPNGLPNMIDPDGGDVLVFDVFAEDKNPDTSTAMLHYNDGSGYVSVAAPYQGNNRYEGTFGQTTCANTVEFYVSIETTDGEEVTSPGDAPASAYSTLSAKGINEIVVDNFESNNGWTVENVDLSDGAWTRGVPAGDGDRGDPTQDADGSGACWLTDNVAGNSDVDGGPTRILSPNYSLAGTDPVISYARWFYNDDNDADRLTVEVSNNGGSNWTTVESVGDQGGSWKEFSFRLADYVTPTNSVRLRVSATDNPNDSVTEAGFDNLRIEEIECGGPSDCLTLTVDNLVAGQQATFTITNGAPGVRAVTVYGFQAGSTVVDNVAGYCAAFGINGVNQSKVLGGLNQTFDGAGEISFGVNIPSGTSGTNVLFQSAQRDTCPGECVSNVVSQVIG